MCVKYVGQKASINNIISKLNFLNKDILRFNLWTTTKFELKCLKTLIYSHSELEKGYIDFKLWNCELTVFELTVFFNIEEIGIRQRFDTEFELSVTLI